VPRLAAVEHADAVVPIGHADGEHRHAELAAVGVDATDGHHLLDALADALAEQLQVRRHQLGGEGVVASRHRGVGGEDVPRRGGRAGHLEAHPPAVHQAAHALQGQERRVALVHVAHRRLHPDRGQQAHAAHSEQELLADAVPAITAIERVGERAILGEVGVQVGVEEVERHAADVGPPRLQHHLARAARGAGYGRRGHGDPHGDRITALVAHQLHRQIVPVVRRVVLRLPALRVQALPEIPEGEGDAHPDQR
jgi:hypothetical protein